MDGDGWNGYCNHRGVDKGQMMNLHDFLHISAMIHCEVRRVLQKLPLAMEAERKLMMEIKDLIEAYDVDPKSILKDGDNERL